MDAGYIPRVNRWSTPSPARPLIVQPTSKYLPASPFRRASRESSVAFFLLPLVRAFLTSFSSIRHWKSTLVTFETRPFCRKFLKLFSDWKLIKKASFYVFQWTIILSIDKKNLSPVIINEKFWYAGLLFFCKRWKTRLIAMEKYKNEVKMSFGHVSFYYFSLTVLVKEVSSTNRTNLKGLWINGDWVIRSILLECLGLLRSSCRTRNLLFRRTTD